MVIPKFEGLGRGTLTDKPTLPLKTNHRLNTLTLPETNSSPLKVDGWKMKFPFGKAYFQRRTVSFREGSLSFCQKCLVQRAASWYEEANPAKTSAVLRRRTLAAMLLDSQANPCFNTINGDWLSGAAANLWLIQGKLWNVKSHW